MPAYLLDSKILLDSGKVAISDTCCCGECPCTKTVDITIRVIVTDNESGCMFLADQSETLVSGDVVDICSVAYGPFNFTYPAYDNGQISITSIGITGDPFCIVVSDYCSAFNTGGCGSGFFCFSTGDIYQDGDAPCPFSVTCPTSQTVNLHWTFDDGLGFSIVHIMTITIS